MIKNIPTEILNKYLKSDSTELPKELMPFANIVDISVAEQSYDKKENKYIENIIDGNNIIDIYKITHLILQKQNDWNTNKAIIFTKNEKQKELDFEENYNIITKNIGNINYVTQELLTLINNKLINENKFLKCVANTRQLPIQKKAVINIDARKIQGGDLFALMEKDDKLIKEFCRKEIEIVYDINIPSGLIIHLIDKKDANIPTFQLQFNLFDKADIKFKKLKINATLKQINEAIKYLQKIIINYDDLKFFANITKEHYFNCFDPIHRRIQTTFSGGTGTGKTMMCLIFADLFNTPKEAQKFNFDTDGKFNEILKNTACVIQDEYEPTKDAKRHTKRICSSETINIEEKYLNKISYPCYIQFIANTNEITEKLVEKKDNRNYIIKMEIDEFVEGAKEAFNYLYNKNNWKTIQTTLIYIALQNPIPITDLGTITRLKTTAINIDKIDFSSIWSDIKEQIEINGKIAIHKKIFTKYFINNKALLEEKDKKNFKKIFNIKMGFANKNSDFNIIEYDYKTYTYSINTIEKGYNKSVIIIEKEHIKDINNNIAFDDIDKINENSFEINQKQFVNLQNKIATFLKEKEKNYTFNNQTNETDTTEEYI